MITKAFDSVNRDLAWHILCCRGAPAKFVAVLRDLHTNHKGIIRAELDSQQVDIDKGFKQGCVLAPDLFNIYLDTIVRQLLQFLSQRGVSISFSINGELQQKHNPAHEELLCILMHADNTALVIEDADSLRVEQWICLTAPLLSGV